MKSAVRILWYTLLIWGLPLAWSAATTVTGRVTDGQAGLRNTVVWLEPQGALPTFPPPQQHAEMAQVNLAFTPRVLPILVGTTVDFPNRDTVYHSIFSFSRQQRLDIGLYPPGEQRTVTFDKPGLVKLFCNIHDHMFGAILVLPTPYFTISTADGSFTILAVPPGVYTVHVWHEQWQMSPRTLTVGEEATSGVTLVLHPQRSGP